MQQYENIRANVEYLTQSGRNGDEREGRERAREREEREEKKIKRETERAITSWSWR